MKATGTLHSLRSIERSMTIVHPKKDRNTPWLMYRTKTKVIMKKFRKKRVIKLTIAAEKAKFIKVSFLEETADLS
jgi:hypothetical protein